MLISHRKKFIFTKTVKTAGTSVESYFEKYCMPDGEWCESHARDEYVSESGIIGYRGGSPEKSTWYNHMSAKEIYELIGQELWGRYYKFTIIRNPFDKLISAFYFSIHRNLIDMNNEDSEIDCFREWIRCGGIFCDRDKYMIDGKECVDFYIQYESLHEGLKQVCTRLSIPFLPASIPEFKKGIRSNKYSIKEFFDNETAQIVCEKYNWEIERFGYNIPK